MAKKPVAEQLPTNSWGMEALVNRLYSFVDSLNESKRMSYGIGWGVIAVVLMVVSSLNFSENLSWIGPVIGWPAGIIVFGIILGIIRTTNIKNMDIFQFKKDVPPSKRLLPVMIGVAVAAAILIFLGVFIPKGVGGAIVIVIVLSAYNIIRRTPEEIELSIKGLPDPRELNYDSEEEQIEENSDYYYEDADGNLYEYDDNPDDKDDK